MQITYEKRDGSILKRNRNTILPYNIGDTTSMGWKVLNIEYLYKNKYYPAYEYSRIIQNKKQSFIRKKQIKDMLFTELKTILYYIIIMKLLFLINI